MDYLLYSEQNSLCNLMTGNGAKVQLPLPSTYFTKMWEPVYNASYLGEPTPSDEHYKSLVASFVNNMLGESSKSQAAFCSEVNNNCMLTNQAYIPLNYVSNALNEKCVNPESSLDSMNLNFDLLMKNSYQVTSTKEYSEDHLSDVIHIVDANSKAPTKDQLYQLSTMIQNTSPEFENFKSGESVCGFVDEFNFTSNGLYVSKNINGFNWAFEIYFEKNSSTSRNRRLLKCCHGDCDKVFKKAWNLFDHIRIHTGEKPYSCLECGKRFAQNGNLTKHMKLHIKNERKIHSCGICGKKYTEKFNLRVHLKKHNENSFEASD